jgi:U3 small nucleolar RNA-associated protein MPP10
MTEPSISTSSFENVLDTFDVAAETFLQPSPSLQAAALVAAKKILDPVIADYSVFGEVALKGLEVEQVWEQIRLVCDKVNSILEEVETRQGRATAPINGIEKTQTESEDGVTVEGGGSDEEENEDVGLDSDELQSAESEKDEESLDDDDEFPRDPELDGDSDDDDNDDESVASERKPFKKDAHGLNDEFFSIDDFNRLTEQQDTTRSDDENEGEIDYFGGAAHYGFY